MSSEAVLDDYLDQLLGDAMPVATTAAGAALAPVETGEPMREPTWDDLPDEVIYETGEDTAGMLIHADSPSLQAAFEAAAEADAVELAAAVDGATTPVAASVPALPPRTSSRATSAAIDDAVGPATTWRELQEQALSPAHSPPRRAAERSSRWLRLRCGSQAYALELLKVQEVVLPVPLLPLRGTAPAMLGIMNLRGQVVPVMDLGIHLGGAPVSEDAQTRIVVLEEHGEIMGLRVSAVEDVTNLSESQIEPPDTARICRISNDIFRGVARLQQQPMILLDATRLLD